MFMVIDTVFWNVHSHSLSFFLSKHSKTQNTCRQCRPPAYKWDSFQRAGKGRPKRDRQGCMLSRAVRMKNAFERVPLFFRVSPTKALFPIQDTRSLDNTDTGTSRQHSGGGIVQQNQSPSPLRAKLSTPQTHFNSLCGTHMHTQKQTHSQANSHKIPRNEVGVCFSGLTVGIMTSLQPPPTSRSHSTVIYHSRVGPVNTGGFLALCLFFVFSCKRNK